LFDLFRKDEVNKLYENLSQCKNDRAIQDNIELFLKDNLLNEALDKRVSAAHHLITNEHMYKVEEISSILNVTPTTLRNLFNKNVGISPKDLIKIHRIKKALGYQLPNEESLTQVAYHLNYFDQAHFCKDFKDSIGISPKLYFLDSKLSSDFSDFQHWRYDNFKDII
jgi:AraC-like DNA-binding protein